MTFYITTNNDAEPGFVDTWQRAVKDGHELGNHSVHHCHANLTGCTSGQPAATLDAEIDEATTLHRRAHRAKDGLDRGLAVRRHAATTAPRRRGSSSTAASRAG